MTPQEVIGFCEKFIFDDRLSNKEILFIKTALEKQIPKKPVVDEYTGIYFCPCCNCGTEDIEGNNWDDDYCRNCGQAIDWSDD